MNNTDEMTRRLDVATYVDRVKVCFGDLPAEDREELVDGLEADLTERLMESSPGQSPEEVFGPPLAYADELRAAAGYPSTATVRTRTGSRIRSAIGRGRDRLEEVRTTSRGESVEQFLETLRPVWWVLRAWVALEAVDFVFGSYPHQWMISAHGYTNGLLLLGLASFVSVQIGRGAWWPGNQRTAWSRRLLFVINTTAAVALVFVVGNLDRGPVYRYVYEPAYRTHQPSHGLRLDGRPVDNVYAYDAQGNPLIGVQLFDGDGNPLSLSPDHTRMGRHDFDVDYAWPWTIRDDRTNVYPLPTAEEPDPLRSGNPFAGDAQAMEINLPFATVPALSAETMAAIEAVTGPDQETPARKGDQPSGRRVHSKTGQGG
jgi:hypothetical protein